MEFSVPCECGQHVTVSEGTAGTDVICRCGRTVHVPSLGNLRQYSILHVEAASPGRGRYSTAQIILVVVGVIVFGGLFILGFLISLAGGNGFALVGYLVGQAGQIWLLFLIVRECKPDAIFYALVIPFFTWYFGYQRLDIAKVPLLLSVAGFLLCLASAIGRG